MQCVLVEDDKNDTKGERRNYQATVETCHVFEGTLPNYLLSNAQLNPTGIPEKKLPTTLLQGDLAPDLFGIRTRRSADYTQEDPMEIEECFLDPSEVEINYEVRPVSNRLRQHDSQSCYEDVVVTGVSEDLIEYNMNKSSNQNMREGRQRQTSVFKQEPIYQAFPSLTDRPLSDRWMWLNSRQRGDDGMCVATLPGKVNYNN